MEDYITFIKREQWIFEKTLVAPCMLLSLNLTAEQIFVFYFTFWFIITITIQQRNPVKLPTALPNSFLTYE
jgi:hypothetical protein